jgi:hypothetical protein
MRIRWRVKLRKEEWGLKKKRIGETRIRVWRR